MSSFLLDYPFAERLFPGAHELLKHMRTFGPTVILSDGDVVFLPRKVERAGLAAAVDDRVLLYVHKEEALDDVEPRYRAGHYAVVDDKLRILTAIKRYWRARYHRVRVSKELCPGSRRRQRVTGSGRGGRAHRGRARLGTAPVAGSRVLLCIEPEGRATKPTATLREIGQSQFRPAPRP